MSQNFNVDPYYDDFDPSKNFHRILFRPGRAVQARELTQAQTILQSQISKFADNIFTQNTPVTGGKTTTNLGCHYLKLNTLYNGATISAGSFVNKIIQDSTGTILARVIATAEATGTDTTAGDPPTLIVNYMSGGQFSDGMTITPTDGTNIFATTIGTVGGTTSTGYSSVASISDGVFYVVNGYSYSSVANSDGSFSKYSIGNFVSVQPQTTILNKYNNTPSYRVGLEIQESIVDYIGDNSLLDPAIGATNYQAPGADRYQITLSLTTLPLEVGNDDQFIELMRIENGNVVKQVDNTVYSVIDDYMAKRTFDTNGDYLVTPFKLTPSSNTSGSLYDINISKGVAYVRGYRLENQSSLKLTGNRARTTDSVTNNSLYVDYGSYLYVNSVKGSSTNIFDITTMPAVDLHVVPTTNISKTNTATYSSTVAATARIRNLEYDHYKTATSNTASYVYRAHLFDVETKTLSSNASSATSNTITVFDTTGAFTNVSSAYVGTTVSINSGTSFGDVRTITAYNGSTKTFTVNQNFSVTPDATSQFTIRLGVKDIETMVIANSGHFLVSTANVDETSKVGTIGSGDVTLQDTGYPELLFKVGGAYVNEITDSTYYSKKVFRNQPFSSASGTTSLTLPIGSGVNSILDFEGSTGSALPSGQVLSLFTFVVKNKGTNVGINNGDILDMTAAGRSITISNDKNTATIVAADLTTPLSVDIIAKVAVTNADNTGHILKAKNLVQASTTVASNLTGTVVNTNTYVTLTEGQVYIKNAGLVSPGSKQSLYIADVKKLIKVIDTKSSATLPTVAMLTDSAYDVTTYYTFDNGQRDGYYDHASLTLKPGAPQAKGNLLVLVDYYSHGAGDGYFSVMSYKSPVSSNPENYAEIPNYTSKNGTIYPLRDCLDFRPSRQNATDTFVFEYTSDPTISDAGSLIPENFTNFTSNYSYYLAKKDLLVLSKDKSFQIIEGVPSTSPIYPRQPDGSLLIGKFNLDPYTAYIPGENPPGTLPNMSVETVQHKRYTMQDISDLQTRINNIEYYTSLNLLEQKASSMQVPDVNGLNRFKNGILVDDFSSFATADTTNSEFSANINKRTRQLTAAQTVSNFPLQNPTVINSITKLSSQPTDYAISTVNHTTNIFTLPFTTANVVTQQLASSTVNVNPFGSPIHQGTVDLNPPMDNWVDNTKEPDLLIVDPSLQVLQQSQNVNLLQAGDWKVLPGTTTTSVDSLSTSFNVLNHGAFDGPFGRIVGYTQTDTTTTTSTYGTMYQNNTMGFYSNISNTYSINNNYITDISVQPYIRPQQILIKAKGLLVNTPITTLFDGQIVDKYMTEPDVVELSAVSGTFNEGDVLGYTENNKFYPIATVVASYVYPGTTKVRLYITGNFHSAYQADLPLSTVHNAFFDADGKYVRTTASGTVASAKIVTEHKSGYIGRVGGNFTDVLGSSISYYRVACNHGAFSDAYGVWGSPTSTSAGTNLPHGKFAFEAPYDGTYYLRVSADDAQTGYVKVNGTTHWSVTSASGGNDDYTITLTKGTNHIEMYSACSEPDGDQYLAAAISTAAWGNGADTSGRVIWGSNSVKGATSPLNGGTQVEMPGGGLYYVGATQVSLNGIANANTNFYTGSTISFSTVYITLDAFGKSVVTPETYTATITAYDGPTCTATLGTPVNLSVGGNAILGGTDTTSFYTITGTEASYSLALQKGALSKLSTDESGTYVGIFNVPKGVFKTGERVFRVDNRLVSTDATTSTCYAEGTFTASGLSTRSQALDFGASISGAKNTFSQTKYLSNQFLGATTDYSTTYSPWDPVAQTFIVAKENYPNGLFLDSISLFFRTKPTTTNSPITLSIVGTQNGYPNGETLDYSIVTLTPDKVKTSSSPHYLDANTKTTFKFQAPVYIQPGVLYAFIVKSPSTEYNLFTAGQNGTAIASSAKVKPSDPTPASVTKIGTAPYVGALFESQNGITWTADQTKSMMMVIDRCVFNTNATPIIPFVVPYRLPYRKQTTGSIKSMLDANNVSNITGNYAAKDVESHAYNITTTDFTPTNTIVAYNYNATLKSTQGKVGQIGVSPGKYGSPTYDDIYMADGQGPRLLQSSSNNSFILNAVLGSIDSAISPVISDDGLALYNIEWSINNMELSNTQISLVNGGSGYNDTPNASIIVSGPDLAGGTQAVATANVEGGVIQSITFSNPGSGYLVAPTITISGANTTPAEVSVVSEFSPRGGNAACKYYTKKVVMTAGNDSQDLRVFYSAYRPTGTNIYVFYKLLDQNDPSTFDSNEWQLMTTVGENKNAYSSTRSDLYEFEAAPGTNGIADNYISYVGANGQTYYSFIQFAIKVVITTDDKTKVPFLTDLRALALPSGTGM